MIHLLLPLLAALAPGDSVPRPFPPPQVVETGELQAMVVVHQQPAVPMVALRLALLSDDPPGYAGAGHLFQHLHEPALRERVARVGGRVQMQRTSDAVVYTVSGPAGELAYLADALRATLQLPETSGAELLRAGRELQEERLAEWETAESHVRSALRARLFPNDLSAAGTETSAERLRDRAALRAAWAELYRPDRTVVVAVGDVQLEAVRAAFAELPPRMAREGAEPPRDSSRTSVSALAQAEATRGWLGAGYLGSDLSPAAVSVAARVVRNRLRERIPGAQVEAEHWWTHHGQALAILVAVPGASLPTARRTLGTALSTAAGSLTAAEVRAAAQLIRREMLFYARTPDRMADVLGRFVDRSGHADAAQRFYAELEAVEVEEVRQVLNELMGRSPARVEIPPQRLQR